MVGPMGEQKNQNPAEQRSLTSSMCSMSAGKSRTAAVARGNVVCGHGERAQCDHSEEVVALRRRRRRLFGGECTWIHPGGGGT